MVAGLLIGSAAVADTPQRIVSMNLCTDQLLMMLADPQQIVSLSPLAADPMTSALADQAAAFPANTSAAEQIYLSHPDLVLAGTYTAQASVQLLRDFGIPVEQFEPATTLEQVPEHLRRVGALIGHADRAEALIAKFEADLAALRDSPTTRPRAALYYANGYSLGDQTLAGQVILAAGFANVATELGHDYGGRIDLEQMVLAAPDVIISGDRYATPSRSEEILDHPALRPFATAASSGPDWICGTPVILRAVHAMREARSKLEAGQ